MALCPSGDLLLLVAAAPDIAFCLLLPLLIPTGDPGLNKLLALTFASCKVGSGAPGLFDCTRPGCACSADDAVAGVLAADRKCSSPGGLCSGARPALTSTPLKPPPTCRQWCSVITVSECMLVQESLLGLHDHCSPTPAAAAATMTQIAASPVGWCSSCMLDFHL